MRANLTKNDGQYSITSATNPGGGPRKPRTTTIALSDCVCYDADMNVIRTIAHTASPAKKQRTNRTPRTPVRSRRDLIDHALMSKMGSIHENDV